MGYNPTPSTNQKRNKQLKRLPRELLLEMSQKYELSLEQEEVFLLRMGEHKSYEAIAEQIGNTSPGACLKRMGMVYHKMNITGSSRGKELKLRRFLIEEWEKINARLQNTPTPPKPEPIPPETLIPPQPQPASPFYQNLPLPDYTRFVGRSRELNRLLELLSPNHAAHLISVDGIGGVGKTTLVLEAAYQCRTARLEPEKNLGIPIFDAIILTSAKQQFLTPMGLLERTKKANKTLPDICCEIARTLERRDINHTTGDAQLERTSECLSRQRTLLIIDNLETIENQDELLSFLYDLPVSVKVVITTREQAIFVPIRLSSLPEAESLELIQHHLQEKSLNLAEKQMQEIYQKTSGIPAAMIYIIGQLAANYSLNTILEKVRNAEGDVARFCFHAAVSSFAEKASHYLLMAVAMFPKSATEIAIGTVAGINDPIARDEGMAKLKQMSLVREEEGRYTMLTLTQEYANAELAKYPSYNSEARARWVDFYQNFAEKNGVSRLKWYQEPEKVEKIDIEWDNLQAVIEWCCAENSYEDVLQLWLKVKDYVHIQGYWHKRLDWTKWLIEKAKKREDWSNLATIILDRVYTLTFIANTQELAEADKLLTPAQKLLKYRTDSNFRFELFQEIVYLKIRLKQYEEALNLLQAERKILQETPMPELEYQRFWFQFLYYEAQINFHIEKYSQAKKLYRQALQLAEKFDWKRAIVYTKNWWAGVLLAQASQTKTKAAVSRFLREVEELLEDGLPTAQRNQDKRCIACYQASLAKLRQLQGNLPESQEWATQARDGFDKLGMIPEFMEMETFLKIVKKLQKG